MAEEAKFKTKVMPWPVDSAPGWGFSVLAGFQHVFTLFGATTLVPILYGNTMGMSPLELGIFIATVYMVMGIATLIQCDTRLGSGLPLVQGSSFSFIPAVTAIIGSVKEAGGGVKEMMQAIGGAIFYGGIFEFVVGFAGLVGQLKKIVTPVVIGPTIMLIGFSLAGTAVSNASTSWPIALAVVALIFIFSLIVKKSVLNSFSVFISFVIMYLFCLLGTLVGWFPEEHAAYVNLQAIAEAPWIVWPRPFRYGFAGTLKFNTFAFTAIVAAYISSIIESFGDYHSISYASGLPDPSPKTISKGIAAEGIGCIISGMLGGVGSTSYTENIGVVALTGIASRRVIRTGAVILIIMGFLWKFGTIIGTMPSPIIGGAYISLFGLIGALGIQVLSRADLTSTRNLMIVAFCFLMGLGCGPYFAANPVHIGGISWLEGIVNGILRTSMAVGAFSGMLLDNIIPGTLEERGVGIRESAK